MILRRVIEHVKTQNWTAVTLDFMIVVVGVFVGLQVTNWNQERQEHAQEQAILERLQEESQYAVGYWRDWAAFFARSNEDKQELLDVLASGRMTSAQESAVQNALETMFHYPANNPPRAVLDEILSSGGFARISNETARASVSRYLAELEFIDGQLEQFRLNFPQFLRAYEGRVFSVYAVDDPTLRRFEFDLEALAGDSQFKSDIVDLVRDQTVFQNYRVNMVAAAETMCATLSVASGTSCEPAPGNILERTGVRPEGNNQ